MGLGQRGMTPVLGAQPGLMPRGPGGFRGHEATAVAQQKLGQPVSRAQQVGPNIFATAEQITRRFFVLGRNVNRRQGAGATEHGELCRIASIGFDPLTRLARD